jgi:predicted peptidase
MSQNLTRRHFVRGAAKCAAACACGAGLASLCGCSIFDDVKSAVGLGGKSTFAQGGSGSSSSPDVTFTSEPSEVAGFTLTPGTPAENGFTIDSVLSSNTMDDVHFCIYVPATYDGQEALPLFITLSGQQGYYAAGAGANLAAEDFAFTALDQCQNMIVVAPQFDAAGQAQAVQVVSLVQWLEGAYNINRSRVFIEGYDGGAQTLSMVLERQPSSFCAALFCGGTWSGAIDSLVNAEVPVYMVVAEDDSVADPAASKTTAMRLREFYKIRSLSDDQIAELVVYDVKSADYLAAAGVDTADTAARHSALPALVAHDSDIMSWLISR